MSKTTKIALLMFYAGFLGLIVVAYLASVSTPEISTGLKWASKLASAALLVGTVLCWREGWKSFNENSGGRGFDHFLVRVWFAPFSLPFR